MADKRISQLVDRGTVANNDVVPIVVSGATTTNKATISSIQTFMQGNLDLGVTSVGITLGSSGTDVSVSGSPITSSGNITINLPTASATNRGLLSAADWTTFNSKQQAITLTTTGTSGAATLVSGTLNIPNYSTDLSGYVTLGTDQTITAQKTFTTSGSSDTMIISHGSGSGFALDVLKAGNGEAIRVTKTSGSGNAVTISGGNFEAGTIVKTGGTSSQFLKADGSIDSNTYLTTGSATSTYVPYSGAAASVNLGVYSITANAINSAGSGSTAGQINLRSDAFFSLVNGYGSIASGTTNQFNLYQTTGAGVFRGAILSLNSITPSATRTFTFPDASGTLALSTDLGAYLPLTGGTLTGALNGTSASFTGALIVSNNAITQDGTRPIITLQQSGNTKVFLGVSSGASDLVTGDSSGDAVFRKPASSGAFRFSVDGGSSSALTIASTGAATFSSSVTSSLGSVGANFNSNAGTTGSVNAYRVSHTSGIGSFGLEANAGGDLMIGGLANATLLQSVSNTPLQLGTNQTARLTILANGNVGIGTASPTNPLHVETTGADLGIQIYRNVSFDFGSAPLFLSHKSTAGVINTVNIEAMGMGAMLFRTGATGLATFGTERMRITSDGYARLSSSSGGIQFNGDTAAANALDDYEEGTWTPTLPNGGTLAVVNARYVKIGQKVTVSLYVNLVNPTNNSSEFRIGGLPFASTYSSPSLYYGGSFGYMGNGNLSTYLPITGSSFTHIYFHANNGTGAIKTNANYITDAGANGDIILTITYFAAS